MFEIGNKLYFFVAGDEEGTMNTVVLEDDRDVEYYTELVKQNSIELFKVE